MPALLLLLLLTMAAAGETVRFQHCPQYGADVGRNCSVHGVQVQPCAEAASGQACRVRKGRAASIAFSFTPEASAQQAEALAYWHGATGDVAFQGMDADACRFTACPLVAGVPANYSYHLNISKKFPSREYSVMWKLWNKGEPLKLECCFIVRIKILGVGKS